MWCSKKCVIYRRGENDSLLDTHDVVIQIFEAQKLGYGFNVFISFEKSTTWRLAMKHLTKLLGWKIKSSNYEQWSAMGQVKSWVYSCGWIPLDKITQRLLSHWKGGMVFLSIWMTYRTHLKIWNDDIWQKSMKPFWKSGLISSDRHGGWWTFHAGVMLPSGREKRKHNSDHSARVRGNQMRKVVGAPKKCTKAFLHVFWANAQNGGKGKKYKARIIWSLLVLLIFRFEVWL